MSSGASPSSVEIDSIAAVLALLFFVVFLICLLKDFIPSLRKYGKQFARIPIFYSLILFSSLTRSLFFLAIAFQLFGFDFIPEYIYIGLWWIPDFLISIAFISYIYLWCNIFSSSRSLYLFTQKKFRKQLQILELALISFVLVFQICIYTLTIFSNPFTWTVVDQILIGVFSLLLALLPVNIYVLIKIMTKSQNESAKSGVKLSHKLLIILAFWIFGRLARSADCFSTVPSWSTWDKEAPSDFFWIYVGGLYMFTEFIPEILILLTSIMTELVNYKFSPQNKNKKQVKKEDERMKLLNEVKSNYKRIQSEDLDFVGEELGSGAFATVQKGIYNRRSVAIKNFNQKLIHDRAFFELFCHEVEIMSNIKHPNIIEFIGVCIDNLKHEIYIVTELAEKGSLSKLLRDHSISISDSQLTKWALHIANGMHYLHSCNIMHRDLKAENILVTKRNVCKVADFGVSRIFKDYASSTGTSLSIHPTPLVEFTQVGTLSWMAPEMFHAKKYDLKVDVYSYAIILWEMMSRESPLNDIVANEIEEKIRIGMRPHIPNGPPHLIDLMKRCWAENPEDRPSFLEIVKYLNDHYHDSSNDLYSFDSSTDNSRPSSLNPTPIENSDYLDYN